MKTCLQELMVSGVFVGWEVVLMQKDVFINKFLILKEFEGKNIYCENKIMIWLMWNFWFYVSKGSYNKEVFYIDGFLIFVWFLSIYCVKVSYCNRKLQLRFDYERGENFVSVIVIVRN